MLADHLREHPSSETESEVERSFAAPHIIERAVNLPHVVIRAEDLRLLADDVDRALGHLNQGLSGNCEIQGADGSTYKSDLNLLRDVSAVRGRVNKVTIYAFLGQSKISITLEHGKSVGKLRLASDNKEWLGATQSALLELFDGLEPQRTFSRWQRMTAAALIYSGFLGLSIALTARLSDLGSHLVGAAGHKKTVYESWVTPIDVLISVLVTSLSIVAIFTVNWWMTSLFPATELQVGKPHTRREAQRRNALAWVASVIILPAVIAIVVGVL